MKSNIEKGELKKPVRTLSGVTPLTVVLKPRKCNHGTCIYCPGGEHTPQSYTDKSPAIMRATALNYDPYEQTKNRLNILNKMSHPTEKIEIIILGGTFLQYDKKYKYNFIKKIYDALNGKESKNLEEAKKINETAEHRCVAMCIENRPDNCSIKEIEEMLEFGATRVEIGVQIPDDEIYKKINRGHTIKDVIESTKRLKEAGFKVGYHFMPGLPYSNPKKDIEKFKMLFESKDFRPDQLKIYPCQIIQDSPLEKMYKKIGFTPYDTQTAKKLITEMMTYIPDYCRVMRMMREIPKERMIGEPIKLDLRKEVEDTLRNSGKKIHEIRMREIGFVTGNKKSINKKLKIKIHEYEASDGKELFLEIVNKEDILFGLLRLRFSKKTFISELKDCAIIRELHIYGKSLELGKEGKEKDSQHIGLGKMLMKKAEEIARENGFKSIGVISGIGVREYYKKLGYKLGKFYMIKKL
jgi:elongator complex protein 3